MKFSINLTISLLLLFLSLNASGQLSPGELAEPHAFLEGMSNCTKCHELGKKVSDEKCLACHTELKSRIDQKKGYHASSKVYKISCIECHSDHHSLKFDIVHFDKSKFDHQTTGYLLEGKHKEKKCVDCHKAENITDQTIKKKKFTYLGLSAQCLGCHTDYHQKTMSVDCATCHSFDAFKPATKFDHSKSKFPLKGKHQAVDCVKCHEISTLNGNKFQKFKGIQFNNCVNCHKDVHDNKFGPKCVECHSEDSFKAIKGIGSFDHSKTNFKLEGKHVNLACKLCHKVSLTAPLKYARCMDCHSDTHNGQFTKKAVTSDCKDCHNQNGYQNSSFTLERHNNGTFKLEGAHTAIPCTTCHKKEKDWVFVDLAKDCAGCHKNIHQGIISDKYLAGGCDKCHITSNWNTVNFDHKITTFELNGKHKEKSCRDCHFIKGTDNQIVQQFSKLSGECKTCHADVHQSQFDSNGKVDCTTCHGGFDNWKADKFNHNTTRFKLDGGHKDVKCNKCHYENKNASIPTIQYKNTGIKCSSCHI